MERKDSTRQSISVHGKAGVYYLICCAYTIGKESGTIAHRWKTKRYIRRSDYNHAIDEIARRLREYHNLPDANMEIKLNSITKL